MAQRLGFAPFGLKFYSASMLTFNKLKSIQITLFYNADIKNQGNGTNPNQDYERNFTNKISIFKGLVDNCVQSLFLGKMKDLFNPLQVIFHERYVSEKTSNIVINPDQMPLSDTSLNINTTSL